MFKAPISYQKKKIMNTSLRVSLHIAPCFDQQQPVLDTVFLSMLEGLELSSKTPE